MAVQRVQGKDALRQTAPGIRHFYGLCLKVRLTERPPQGLAHCRRIIDAVDEA